MKQLLFIRHGETAGNRMKRYIGATDEPVCPEGRAFLKQLGQLGLYPNQDALFLSPMQRCRDTAAILYPHKKGVVVPDLRECNFGRFENKRYDDLKDDPAYRFWLEHNCRTPIPEGEALTGFLNRCTQAFLQLPLKDTNCVIAHGGSIRAILSTFGPGLDFFHIPLKHGGGYVCHWDESKKQLVGIKEVPLP